MKHFYYLFSIALLVSSLGFGQTTILSEDFETDGDGTRYGVTGGFTDGIGDYFVRTNGTTVNKPSGLPSYNSQSSSFYFAAEDTEDGGNPNSDTSDVTFNDININGFTNITIEGLFACGGKQKFDPNDYMHVYIDVDNTGTWTLIGAFEADISTGVNSSNFGLDADLNGQADGPAYLSTTFGSYSFNLGTTGNLLDVKIEVLMHFGDEEVAFDLIEVKGTAPVEPTIGFDSATSSETETDATFTSANIPITVSNYSGSQIDINIDVTGGTAEAEDYTFTSPTSLSFTTDSTQNITLDINEDTDDFDDETIIFTITETSSVSGLIISQSTHTLTITDDEIAPSVGFDGSTSTETETDATFTSANIPITVSNYSGSQIDINVDVTGGTAEAGDYTFTSPTALSFTANETQNITVEVNEDTDDFDDETIILTITETSSVTGLIISQNTHTLTITEDESAPVPTAGSVIITEVLDSNVGFNNDYLELFNNSAIDVSLTTSKLIRMSSGGSFEYAYDFGVDESTASNDVIIPAYGFIIIARASTRSEFNLAYGITLDAGVSFNGGNTQLFFGNGRRWSLKTGGTSNSDDGTLIDDTLTGVGSSKDYRNIFTNTFISGSPSNGTPGELEYLLYIGSAWINSTAMDSTTGAKDAYIYSDYIISSDSDANNLGINTGSKLTLNSSTSLDINSDLTVNGNFDINSGGSLIINGTSTGTVTYNRNIPTTNWYLISSPVEGQTIVDFYTNESPALGSGTGNAQNVAIAPYDNAQALGTDRWNYYTEGQVDGEDGDDTSDTFSTGTGYAIKMQAAGDVAFTGTLRTNDMGVSLSDGSGSGGNAFNFIGNPYTSYISVSELIEEDNVATGNEALLSQQTIWLWDESANTGAGGYVPKNLAADLEIAPGQGFFVLTGSAGTFDITEAMQSHSADTFFTPSSNRPEINLTLTNESETRATDIYYIDGTTTGFDNGYDSSIFGGFENEFAMYTHEVTTDSGRNLGIQSLPDNDYENMIIPVGINATSGMTISISASSVNLPVALNSICKTPLIIRLRYWKMTQSLQRP